MGRLTSAADRGTALSATVLSATYNRAEKLRVCLERLRQQMVNPVEVIVVDASPDDPTHDVVARDFPEAQHLRNPFGAGSTATSRSNGNPGEEHEGAGQIGRLLPNGLLTGCFAADPVRVITVDHLLGANMSSRREVLVSLDGIHDCCPGTCLREESDIALRVRPARWRLLFTPHAAVRHLAGTSAKGRRFDRRCTYYGRRNHVVLWSRIVGRGSPQSCHYPRFGAHEAVLEIIRPVKWSQHEGEPLAGAARGAVGTLRAASVLGGLASGMRASYAAARSLQHEVETSEAPEPHREVLPA